MGFWRDLFAGRKVDEPEGNVRDYDKLAVPDPHTPQGQAPYIGAWVGYAPHRMMVTPSDMHTVGREPRQVPGPYPAANTDPGERERTDWRVAPSAIQSVQRFAPNPGWEGHKHPPHRPQRAPTTYRVTNPFDWQFARNLNGLMFSMASNIRTYAIGGMKPVIPRRNTFRLMPPPHDINQTNVSRTTFDVEDMDMSSPSRAWTSPLARLG